MGDTHVGILGNWTIPHRKCDLRFCVCVIVVRCRQMLAVARNFER